MCFSSVPCIPFLLRLLDLCCITVSLNLLKSEWADGSTAGRAAGDGCIMEFGLDTLRLTRSAVGLAVEILIRDCKYVICGILVRANHFPKYKCVFHTHLDC